VQDGAWRVEPEGEMPNDKKLITDTILIRGLPFAVFFVLSAVFGPNHREHESQSQSSKLGIAGKLENEL